MTSKEPADGAASPPGPRVSAGLVVLRPGAAGEWRCLLLRVYRNWDLPKGLVQPGESAADAAIRETHEATGLAHLTLPWGAGYHETAPYSGGQVARFFMAAWGGGEVVLPVAPELGRPEHHEFRWVPLESAALLLPPRLQPLIAWVKDHLSGCVNPPGPTAAHPDNELVVSVLRELATLLAQQAANPYRVAAYRRAATTITQLDEGLRTRFERDGVAGLDQLPHVGPGLATLIAEVLITGRSAQLDRLRGAADTEPVHPKGPGEAQRPAAPEGSATRTGHADSLVSPPPPVALLLELDKTYRARAIARSLPTIAPRRLNPTGEAWLPVMHTQRGRWHFTLLFSNTARAHELGRTHDWVVAYFHHADHAEGRVTIVTETHGPLAGQRVVRGREAECEAHYAA